MFVSLSLQKNQIEITDVLIESIWYMPLLWWFSGIPRSPVPFVRLLTWDIHSSLHHSSMDSWMTAVWCHLSTMKSTLHIPDSLRKSGSTTWRTETGSGRAGWDAMRLRQLVRSWSVNSIKCTSWANGANAIRHCCDLDSWLTVVHLFLYTLRPAHISHLSNIHWSQCLPSSTFVTDNIIIHSPAPSTMKSFSSLATLFFVAFTLSASALPTPANEATEVHGDVIGRMSPNANSDWKRANSDWKREMSN